MATITVGRALLILLDKHKNDPKKDVLKKLYLTGPCNEKEEKALLEFLKDPALSEYTICTNPITIDNDPTRRYFETHLAYETMRHELKQLDGKELTEVCKTMVSFLDEFDKIEYQTLFKGGVRGKDAKAEVTDAIVSIRSHEHYQTFSPEEKQKLENLMKIAYLSLVLVNMPQLRVPLAGAYDDPDGYFTSSNRGRVGKADQDTVATHHFGLVKGHMPIPRDDIVCRGSSFPLSKPSDRNTFNPDAKWCTDNFKKLVHPFSSSISGTLLAVIRLLALLERKNKLVLNSKEKMGPFLKCFISVFLYNSGGHSLNEFFSVLNLPLIQQGFRFIKGFEEINMQSLITDNHGQAFDKALEKAIAYNNTLLAKNKLHEEIVTKPKLTPTQYPEKKASSDSELSSETLKEPEKLPVEDTSLEKSQTVLFFQPQSAQATKKESSSKKEPNQKPDEDDDLSNMCVIG